MTSKEFWQLVDREVAAANAKTDAKERALDEHGYGGGKAPVDPSQLTGLSGYIDDQDRFSSAVSPAKAIGMLEESLRSLVAILRAQGGYMTSEDQYALWRAESLLGMR